jgi:hypothetical protein
MQKQLKNEKEWAVLTASRLKRSGVSREQWDKETAQLLKRPTTVSYQKFAEARKIPVSADKSVPYSARVKLAVYTIILAIRAKDEEEFRRFVDEEVKTAANSLGIGF